jgi:hypothetical protein
MARSPVGVGRGRLGARRPIDDDGSHQDEWAAIDAGLYAWMRRSRGTE